MYSGNRASASYSRIAHQRGTIARALAWGIAVPLLFVAALMGALRFYVWPQIDRWRAPIEAYLNAHSPVPVRFEGLMGSWEGAWPTLKVARMELGTPEAPLLRANVHLALNREGLYVIAEGDGQLAQRWALQVQWNDGAWHGQVTGYDVALAPLASWHKDWAALAQLQPQLASLSAEFTGREGIEDLSVEFSGLHWLPSADVPGLSSIDGRWEGSRTGGKFHFSAPAVTVRWPEGWFPEPELPLQDFAWHGSWGYDGVQGYRLDTALLQAYQGTMQLTVSGVLQGIGSHHSLVADVGATLKQVPLPQLARYLPPAAVGEETLRWLAQAFVAGTVPAAELRLAGPLAEFPFRNGEGRFAVYIPVREVRLRYDPDWPDVEIREAMIRFENDRLLVEVPAAQAQRLQVRGAYAEVAQLDAPETVLTLRLPIAGQWGDVLNFLDQTPLKKDLPLAQWRSWRLQADAELLLHLTLPLDRAEVGVRGELKLSRGRVPPQVAWQPLTQLVADITFDHHGVTAAQARARWGEAPIEATWLGGAPLSIRVLGRIPATMLVSLTGLPREAFSGSTEVTATLTFGETVQVQGESTLVGLASHLPAPLQKSAAQGLPMSWQVGFAKELREAELKLGDLLRWQRQADGRWAAAIGRGVALPTASAQGNVALWLESLDVDAWHEWLERVEFAGAAAWPNLTLQAQRLLWLDRYWHDVRLRLTPQTEHRYAWQLQAREAMGKGQIEKSDGKVTSLTLEMSHLFWPAAQHISAQTSLAKATPDRWPRLRVAITDLRWKERALGELRLVAHPEGKAWRIAEASLRLPQGGRCDAHGQWNGRQTDLEVLFTIRDLGQTLHVFLTDPGVRWGRGEIATALTWPGSPADFELGALRATGALVMKDGVFEEIEPGVGRLLALVNLGTLLRRLRFDFRDVAQKGLAFDSIRGSFAVAEGYLTTSDLTIDAPVALVQLAGAVDTHLQTQEFEVRVVPRLGSTAATALAFVNPVAGILALLGQQVIGDPIGQLMMQRYRLSGSWDAPTVERIDVAGE